MAQEHTAYQVAVVTGEPTEGAVRARFGANVAQFRGYGDEDAGRESQT
jgi:hypothetical protein